MAVIPPTGSILPAVPAPDLPASAAVVPVRPSSPTGVHAVVADLQLGRIPPDEAVARLMDQALASCPESLRAGVETRLRDVLTHDPLLAALVRHVGAHVPTER